jgi:plasmid rolling circle replication initiator protein Rep
MTGANLIAHMTSSCAPSEARRRPKPKPRLALLIIQRFFPLNEFLPFLETIETTGGVRRDDPRKAWKLRELVKPASGACIVAGHVLIRWGAAVQLQDFTSSGKLRPWEMRREQTLGVAEAYREIAEGSDVLRQEFGRIGGLMLECGTLLEFASAVDIETEDQQRRLLTANFCRGRLCPMCNWRRSQKVGAELEQVVKVYQERNPQSAVVMLTLTERNVPAEDLGQAVNEMSKAFSRLRKRSEWKRAVTASFRSIEVTRPKAREFHPHMHILLFVDEKYFSKAFDLYVPQAEWARLWGECRGLTYRPIVDVRRMKGVSEVTKYVTKSQDYLTWSSDESGWQADTDTIKALHVALKGRRLIAWSRELGVIRKELGCSDDDMDDGGTGFPPEYVVTHREVYRWRPVSKKRGAYWLAKTLPPKDDVSSGVGGYENTG